MDRDYDILIAGGGMVGASLGCALANLPYRVAVIERFPPGSAAQPSFDDRSIALSRSSQRILDGLGLWAGLSEEAAPIRKIHVSQQGRFGNAVIDAQEQGIDSLGYVIPNRRIGHATWAGLDSAEGVDVICPASVEEVAVEPGEVIARVHSGDEPGRLKARLLVIADGARSPLRSAVGIGARVSDYGQTAIIGNLASSGEAPVDMAWERFTAEGPMALLPLAGNRHAFVLTRPTQSADEVIALSDDDFLDLLQKTFGWRLGRLGPLGSRQAYPLSLVEAERVTGNRVAVIGNAAHGLHPVAGQGFNLGLRDVSVLAEVLADACRDEMIDAGDPALLERYARWRRRDQRKVVMFTDGLIRLFGLDFPGAGHLRGLGLLAFDITPGAKHLLAQQTMGLSGRLTRLVRGLDL